VTRVALRPCPLCTGTSVDVLHAMQFVLAAGSSLPAAYDVVACAQCDFVYADTAGSSRDYERHYAERSRYEDAALATGAGSTPADRKRIDAMADWIALHVPVDASVLDIGCGAGGLLLALGARGFRRLAGVDPSATCVARLQSLGLRAWQGTLARMPDQAQGFGLVILSHVLEHVLDVRSALLAARERMVSAGRLYLETPDAARYGGLPFVPFYFFDGEHINHFDAASLAGLCGRCGLEVLAAGEDNLQVEGGLSYPVTRALLAAAPERQPATGGFARLRTAVSAYVEESRRRSDLSDLSALAAHGRPLALWGAGSYAQRLLASPALAGIRFVAVIDRDRNKQGTTFAGCRVAAPESALQDLPRNAVIVVAAALASEAIVAECRTMGIDCYVPADAR